LHLREIVHQRLRHRVRCAGLRVVALPNDAIQISGVRVKFIVAGFLLQVQRDDEYAGNAERQTEKVDCRVDLIAKYVPDGDLEVVEQHGGNIGGNSQQSNQLQVAI
jgi:hypothetical protein